MTIHGLQYKEINMTLSDFVVISLPAFLKYKIDMCQGQIGE